MGRTKTGKSDRVKQLYESGSSIEEIAIKLGYKPSSVKAILHHKGVRRKKMAKHYHNEIEQMVEEGKSIHEIAKKIELSTRTVGDYIYKTGMKEKGFRATSEELEMCNLQFAEERKPVIEKVIYRGKAWEDITELYLGW